VNVPVSYIGNRTETFDLPSIAILAILVATDEDKIDASNPTCVLPGLIDLTVVARDKSSVSYTTSVVVHNNVSDVRITEHNFSPPLRAQSVATSHILFSKSSYV
jgi:hypothetical protein